AQPQDQQYTFALDASDIAPGAELYGCQDVPNPFGKDIAIIKTTSKVSIGAHHMFAFQIPGDKAAFVPGAGLNAADMFMQTSGAHVDPPFVADGKKTPVYPCPAGGLEFHPYFHLTQRAEDTITYPAGVGRSFKASEAVRLQVHFLNTTDH